MFLLMKKNAKIYIIYTVATMLYFLVPALGRKDYLDFPRITFMAYYIVLAIMASISTQESYEEKGRVYHFLRILPLSVKDIVGSKFLNLFITILVMSGFSHLIIIILAEPALVHFAQNIFIFCMALSLVFSSLFYATIFRIGISKTTKFIWLFFIITITATIFLIEYVIRKNIQPDFLASVSNWNPLFMLASVVGALLVFYNSYRISVKNMIAD